MRKRILFIPGILLLLALAALAAACGEPVKYEQVWTPAPPPPDAGRTVRTDYSGLTPYNATKTRSARLSSGPLTELVPSDDYGLLLPYSSAAITESGELQASKYGFVSADGMIVTDLIYDSVDRAYGQYMYMAPTLSAYTLSINLPVKNPGWFPEKVQAACATDGSWITPFEYKSVIYTDEYILLAREYDDYDVDVYDFSGNLLYNLLDLRLKEQLDANAWPGELMYTASEGYARGHARNGNAAFLKLATGELIITNYLDAYGFNEGLAAVQVDSGGNGANLWGFIDKSLRLVIPPKYINPATFVDGYAICETLGSGHIVNKRGESVFSLDAGSGHIIMQNYNDSSYMIYDSEWTATAIYSPSLDAYIPISRSGTAGYTQSIGGGWYAYQLYESSGVSLFSAEEEYYFPKASYISQVAGEYVIYQINPNPNGYPRWGVSTLDGREVLPPEENFISSITNSSGEVVFLSRSNTYYFYGEPQDYCPSTYSLFSADGVTIISGSGILSYDESLRLYSIMSDDSYTYLDEDYNVLVRVPLMSYSLD